MRRLSSIAPLGALQRFRFGILRAWSWNFAPSGAVLLLLYLLFAALLVSRRPDCVQHPQFFAEEGERFFPEARERSLPVDLITCSYGYFDLVIRLAHQFAALVPLEKAPLVLVVIAIAIQAAVPLFLLSSRCAVWLGAFPIRFATALLYCGLPNSAETHLVELHSRVHLAVLAALVIVSAPPVSRRGKFSDAAILVLSGLSGPFAIVLAPVAVWRYWRMRTAATRRNALLLASTFALALFALLASSQARFGVSVGYSFRNAMRIIGGQFLISFLLGSATYARLLHQPYFTVIAGTGLLLITTLTAAICWREKPELQQLLFIGIGLLAIALAAPIGGAAGMTQWRALWSIPGNGQRYYIVPMAMLLFVLAAIVGRGQGRAWRVLAAALLFLNASMAVRVDWNLWRFTDFHFAHYAQLYRESRPGSTTTIPINPPGWQMKLRKPSPPPN
jgi:hypothetical protein